jgi:hypothetical protein
MGKAHSPQKSAWTWLSSRSTSASVMPSAAHSCRISSRTLPRTPSSSSGGCPAPWSASAPPGMERKASTARTSLHLQMPATERRGVRQGVKVAGGGTQQHNKTCGEGHVGLRRVGAGAGADADVDADVYTGRGGRGCEVGVRWVVGWGGVGRGGAGGGVGVGGRREELTPELSVSGKSALWPPTLIEGHKSVVNPEPGGLSRVQLLLVDGDDELVINKSCTKGNGLYQPSRYYCIGVAHELHANIRGNM